MSDAAHRIWNEVWPGVPQEKMREALTHLHPGDRVGPDGAYVVVPVGPTPEMKAAALESAKRTMPLARAKTVAWDAVIAYRAMLAALQENPNAD